jgi:hypothetical protein
MEQEIRALHPTLFLNSAAGNSRLKEIFVTLEPNADSKVSPYIIRPRSKTVCLLSWFFIKMFSRGPECDSVAGEAGGGITQAVWIQVRRPVCVNLLY